VLTEWKSTLKQWPKDTYYVRDRVFFSFSPQTSYKTTSQSLLSRSLSKILIIEPIPNPCLDLDLKSQYLFLISILHFDPYPRSRSQSPIHILDLDLQSKSLFSIWIPTRILSSFLNPILDLNPDSYRWSRSQSRASSRPTSSIYISISMLGSDSYSRSFHWSWFLSLISILGLCSNFYPPFRPWGLSARAASGLTVRMVLLNGFG
jgi:hypothetical protein